MPVTAEDCRAAGLSESQVESMERNGFFEPVSERSDVVSSIEEVECDLDGWEQELVELKRNIRRGRRKLAGLRAKLGTLPPDEDE